MITKICQKCGKEFCCEPSHGKGLYCSYECFNQYRLNHPQHQIAICANCEKEFRVMTPSRGQRCCSRKCSNEILTKIKTTCPICGKEFHCVPSKKQMFCSRKCRGLHDRVVINQPCKVCGKEFVYNPWSRHGQYCSMACYQSTRAVSIMTTCITCGREFKYNPKNKKGKYCSNECRRTIVVRNCVLCNKEYTCNAKSRRKYCSRRCYDIVQNKGHNNGYRGPGWAKQCNFARQRDSYTCQRCGKTEKELGKNLSVHHKIPFRLFGILKYKEANQSDNLICLCESCHHITEHEYERNN
jgi:hypothetical protein